ncbi:MAG: putative toxin-antitoxin system toxin component, PIN family [Candidatus Omnitrophota bacterium]
MIKVILDTNVLISSLFWKGSSRHIVDLAIASKIKSVTSPEIMEEVEAVLYEDFPQVPYEKIEWIIRDILSYSQLIIPRRVTVKRLRDSKDTKIIACALNAKAEYIVTGDKDLLALEKYAEVRILTPKTFLDLFK